MKVHRIHSSTEPLAPAKACEDAWRRVIGFIERGTIEGSEKGRVDHERQTWRGRLSRDARSTEIGTAFNRSK
jgi:hypothetical protein